MIVGFVTGLARITCNDTRLLGNRDPPTVDYKHALPIPATLLQYNTLRIFADRYMVVSSANNIDLRQRSGYCHMTDPCGTPKDMTGNRRTGVILTLTGNTLIKHMRTGVILTLTGNRRTGVILTLTGNRRTGAILTLTGRQGGQGPSTWHVRCSCYIGGHYIIVKNVWHTQWIFDTTDAIPNMALV